MEEYQKKLNHTKTLIMDWHAQFNGNVYVSFSGGKDSTVLLHLARSLYPDIKACFIDTGLEYPEIREFALSYSNVDVIKPKMTFNKVLEKYGFPVISKEQSQYIRQARTGCENTKNRRINGDDKGRFKISKKWLFLLDAPFKISEQCCDVMKKRPAKEYEKKTGFKPIIGTMAVESNLRKNVMLKSECNAFHAKRPISKPLTHWTEDDIFRYIKENNLEICSLYSKGYKRTGCMFCMYGCHNKNDKRFELMKETHPKIHDYCMNKLGVKEIIDFISDHKNTCKIK